MAMTYGSLIAAKGQPGAIATWTNYTLLDTATIVDEAQTLLYGPGRLRCREMMTAMTFTMQQNYAAVALPANFLDPIGPIYVSTFNSPIKHKDSQWIQRNRNYTETLGTLGTNPFTTTLDSYTVNVNLPVHGFTQESSINLSGATAFNGVTLNGTFIINGIPDANDFTIDITPLGTLPTAAGSGGGSAVNYICDDLVEGTPYWYGIWTGTDGIEYIHFDQAVFQTSLMQLQYFRSLPLLSSTNQSNFLTNRYPKLMRTACLAAAAEFMKDDAEYQKQMTSLNGMIEAVEIENEMQFRGLELDPDIPGS